METHSAECLVSESHASYDNILCSFPGSSAGKKSTCIAGAQGSIPGLGRSPEEGKSCPLQYSDLENPMDCIVHGVTKSWTRLSDFHFYVYRAGLSAFNHHVIYLTVVFSKWKHDVCLCVCVCVHARVHTRAYSLSRVQLCDLVNSSPPGSLVHGIFQARMLETWWVIVAVYFSLSVFSIFLSTTWLMGTLCPRTLESDTKRPGLVLCPQCEVASDLVPGGLRSTCQQAAGAAPTMLQPSPHKVTSWHCVTLSLFFS